MSLSKLHSLMFKVRYGASMERQGGVGSNESPVFGWEKLMHDS